MFIDYIESFFWPQLNQKIIFVFRVHHSWTIFFLVADTFYWSRQTRKVSKYLSKSLMRIFDEKATHMNHILKETFIDLLVRSFYTLLFTDRPFFQKSSISERFVHGIVNYHKNLMSLSGT